MSQLSVCIPFKNEFDEINHLVNYLHFSAEPNEIEVIVVNDGSSSPDGSFCPLALDIPNTKVVNIRISQGVGASFDRAIENCTSEIIVLQGADVFPRIGWYEQVVNAVESYPDTIGGATSIGLSRERMDLDDTNNYKRYGAELLFKVGVDDLPKGSKLRQRPEGYTDLLKAKWIEDGKRSDEPYEIPCLLGAFYFTTKEYYTRLGGFDTEKGNRYKGHRVYGHLEPHLSLKSWLVGNGCILHPRIEAGHVFGRIDKKNEWSKGSRGLDWTWWNALWILETMILDEEKRERLYNHLLPELNLGVAKQWIRQNYNEVIKVRELNKARFKNDLSIFESKFGYKI